MMAILPAVTVILRMRLTPRLMSTKYRDDSSLPAGQPGRRQSPELDSDDDHLARPAGAKTASGSSGPAGN